MYRTLSVFESKDARALSFQAGTSLTLIDCTRNAQWWLMMNDKGQTGYVPANYLSKMTELSTNDVVKSIERGIEFIHLAATKSGGVMNQQQRENLQRLIQHRNTVLKGQQTDSSQASSIGHVNSHKTSTKSRAAPAPPSPTPLSSGSTRREAPPPPLNQPLKEDKTPRSENSQERDLTQNRPSGSRNNERVTSPNNFASPYSSPSKSRTSVFPVPDIPMGLVMQIVEKVRSDTGLSYDKSRHAVGLVLESIKESVPELSDVMDAIIQKRASANSDTSSSSIVLEGGKDYERLEIIFSELASAKEDSQQRGWALHEDESVIIEYLQELQTLLTDADPRVCRKVIQYEGYHYVTSLALYYQMEPRVSIRLNLLKVFGGLCSVDPGVVSHLLLTVLPVEIGRDMQTDKDNFTKLSYSSLVLVMLFSTGEMFPLPHYDHLGSEFVQFLLDTIEDPPDYEDADQLTDLYVNVLLAYNLHFQVLADNLLMKELASNRVCKIFSEKIMLLVNREVDPVRILNHPTNVPNSLLKLMADIFSSRDTSNIFYTNDMMVLIDIVTRQVTNLSAEDVIRTEYMSLIFSIFQNTNYWEHQHRLADLEKAFITITNEEGTEGERDRLILKEMVKQFGDKFHNDFGQR